MRIITNFDPMDNFEWICDECGVKLCWWHGTTFDNEIELECDRCGETVILQWKKGE